MPRTPAQQDPASLRHDREQFTALKAQVAELDFFVRGSLVSLLVRCGKPGCACAKDPDARHGPYVRWTRKVAGKTVSTPLRADEVPVFEKWLANSRRLDDLVDQMHALGLRAAAHTIKARTKA